MLLSSLRCSGTFRNFSPSSRNNSTPHRSIMCVCAIFESQSLRSLIVLNNEKIFILATTASEKCRTAKRKNFTWWWWWEDENKCSPLVWLFGWRAAEYLQDRAKKYKKTNNVKIFEKHDCGYFLCVDPFLGIGGRSSVLLFAFQASWIFALCRARGRGSEREMRRRNN